MPDRVTSAPASLSVLIARILSRTSVRLAAVQCLALATAFLIAGLFSHLAIDAIQRGEMQRQIRGEFNSMRSEFADGGPARIPRVVDKRTRLWRGFDYSWVAANGRANTGALPAGTEATGWSTRCHSTGKRECFLVLQERLPDGSRLSVGQNLRSAIGAAHAVDVSLATAAMLGIAVSLAISAVFGRGIWRRVELLAGPKRLARFATLPGNTVRRQRL